MGHQKPSSLTTLLVSPVGWCVPPVTYVWVGVTCMPLRKGPSILVVYSSLPLRSVCRHQLPSLLLSILSLPPPPFFSLPPSYPSSLSLPLSFVSLLFLPPSFPSFLSPSTIPSGRFPGLQEHEDPTNKRPLPPSPQRATWELWCQGIRLNYTYAHNMIQEYPLICLLLLLLLLLLFFTFIPIVCRLLS